MNDPFVRLSAWIARQPLRRKLLLKSNLIAVVAALVVSCVFAAVRIVSLRKDHLANALATTQLVATNALGAVAFTDRPAATTVLASLRTMNSVVSAAIALPDQPDFATFGRALPLDKRLPAGVLYRFDGQTLYTSALVGDDDKATARLFLVFDLRPALWAGLQAVGLALIAALVLAIALSHFASTRLRQFILRPIENLHDVTQQVGHTADQGLRAPVVSQDELGELTRAFNSMLDRLQTSEASLRTSNESLTVEISERKRLEKALVDTSRQAGMAEVATGILHNVGNVLNSVNISTQVMREALERSQVANLVRAAEMIRLQGANFPQFVADDPKGRLLPPFIVNLSGVLAKEQQAARDELEQLAKNIEHIKEIVSAQQGFAKTMGVSERIFPRELFEEAERIAHASVLRHGIEIRRDYEDAPAFNVDRHRALQILVNFITNAIHAVKPNAPGHRQITLAIAARDGRLGFRVQDNGVGIAQENLSRIFTHGFTTRHDGHGFGLHSGALAARLLQGEVKVESPGLGHGAQFTLLLPTEPKQRGDSTPPFPLPASFSSPHALASS